MTDIRKHSLVLPDLGLDGTTMRASIWLVPKGHTVREGDRLLEVLAGEVTFDVIAPAAGVLSNKLVREDDRIEVGQDLGIVTSRAA
ncbi:MAG: lipoyl domain-containing protein [Pirellulales bacterium]|jgi:pyruvate/2-oxoglutarate dehydrogenase complex dihydrolipoamide acyltransferase (E2) component